jgi:hypothetical protein
LWSLDGHNRRERAAFFETQLTAAALQEPELPSPTIATFALPAADAFASHGWV